MQKFLVPAFAISILLLAGQSGIAVAQTPAACSNYYTPCIAIPSGYGAAYDVVLGSS
jgi:hypothetical protein